MIDVSIDSKLTMLGDCQFLIYVLTLSILS